MIVAIILTAWAVLAVLLSRPIYGAWRAWRLDCLDRERRTYMWKGCDRPMVILGSVFLALFWPVLIPLFAVGYGTYRWMTGTKIRSKSEIAAERDAMQRRIAELEREVLR